MRIDRFGAQDATPEDRERLWAILRQKTPAERFRMTFDRIDFMRELHRATEHLRRQSDSEHR